MGQAKFVATDEQRKIVQALSSYGVDQVEIAKVIGCCHVTLRRKFRQELDTAETIANAKVSETLYRMAVSGRVPSATFFWLKTRAGWRETAHLEVTGRNGGPIKVEMSDAELDERLATIMTVAAKRVLDTSAASEERDDSNSLILGGG